MVKLCTRGKSLLAKAEDLSMEGLRVLGSFPTDETRVTVFIPLPKDREVVTQATVKRRDASSFGVEFDQLDWDDLFALARYLHPRLP
jgi:hypothetical protein